MQCRVLHSSIVPVYRQPVFQCFLARQCLVVLRIDIAQEIPGRSCPLRHGIRLALCLAATARTGRLYPRADFRNRRFPVIRRFIVVNFRKPQWKLFFRNRNITTFFTFYNRNRLTPVTLSGEYPVTQLEVFLRRTDTLFFQPIHNGRFRFCHRFAGEEPGIYQRSGSHIGECLFLHVTALNDFDNRKIKFLRKLPVTGVVGRYCHDGTGSVTHQYIIRYPDRNFFAIHRIDGRKTIDCHTGLVLGKLRTLKIRLSGSHLAVGNHLIPVFNLIFVFIQIRMLRGYNHVRHTKQRVRTSGINTQFLLFVLQGKIHLGTMGAANPVFLGNLHPLNVIQTVQIINQLVCVLRNFQHPLTLHLANYRAATALAHTIDNLLVGKTTFTGSTPVNRHLRLVGKSCFEQFQENPLGPLVIIRIRRVDFSLPVKGITKGLQLCFETCHIILRYFFGMYFIFNGVILCRQSKRIPSHRIQYVVALHPALPCHNIKSRVGTRMSYVKSLSGWIRKFYQSIVLRLAVIIRCLKCFFLFPDFLPFLFNFFWIITLTHVLTSFLLSIVSIFYIRWHRFNRLRCCCHRWYRGRCRYGCWHRRWCRGWGWCRYRLRFRFRFRNHLFYRNDTDFFTICPICRPNNNPTGSLSFRLHHTILIHCRNLFIG